MKKIALLHYSYPPSMGGVELLMQQQGRVLASLGFDIKVLTGSGSESDPTISLIVEECLQSVLQQNPAFQEKIVKEGVIDEDFYQLAKEVREVLDRNLEDRDIIIVHNMTTLIHNLPFLYAFKRYTADNQHKKIIIWAHDQTYVDEETITYDKKGVNLSAEQKDLLLTPISHARYVAISETFADLLSQVMKIPKDAITVIPNGIDMKGFFVFEDRIWTVIKREKILDAYPLLFSPVNILLRKNLIYSLEIVNEMKKEHSSIKYIITGKPSIHRDVKNHYEILKEKVRELNLADNVILLSEAAGGVVSNNTVRDLYNLSDAAFYFSKSENFGLPIVEALLLKTPIFVSDLKVFHEIGQGDLTYIDYKTVSPATAAREIARAIGESGGSRARKRIREAYDLEKIIQKKLLPILYDA